MPFENLDKRKPGASDPMTITMSAKETSRGNVMLRCTIGGGLVEKAGLKHGPATVQIGSDDADGQLRIVNDKDGIFTLAFARRGHHFMLPLGCQPFAPEQGCPKTECLVRKAGKGELVIELPGWCWVEGGEETDAAEEQQQQAAE